MNLAAIEAAIVAWIVAVTGLSTSSVLFSGQNAPRPADPWISLLFTTIERVGQDGTRYSVNPGSNGHDGQEMIVTASGLRRAHLSVQCFGGPATGNSSARALLEKIVESRRLPSVFTVLNAAGIAVGSFGPIQSLGQAVNATLFEPRAQMDVRMNLTSSTTATDTCIDTANVGVEVNDPNGTADPGLDFTAVMPVS